MIQHANHLLHDSFTIGTTVLLFTRKACVFKLFISGNGEKTFLCTLFEVNIMEEFTL